MLNIIWLLLILGGVLVAGLSGQVEVVTDAAMTSARLAVEFVLGYMGIITFWVGLMKVAEESGLVRSLAGLMRPVVGLLFPSLPRDHPAVGAILMNLSANLLGVGSAATPLGLKAMEELQKLNDDRETASDAMCTFLALNTSSVTLIPVSVIGIRAAAGSADPAEIVGTTIFATSCSTLVALSLDYLFRRLGQRRGGGSRCS